MLKQYFMPQKFLKIKHFKETKIKNKEHNNRQNVNLCKRNLGTNKDRSKATKHFWKESV
jgi:hypothetical protein